MTEVVDLGKEDGKLYVMHMMLRISFGIYRSHGHLSLVDHVITSINTQYFPRLPYNKPALIKLETGRNIVESGKTCLE